MPNKHKAHKRGITNEERWKRNQADEAPLPTAVEVLQDSAAKELYAKDFKKFYIDLIASDMKNKITKKSYKETWGKIHDYMVDFLNIGDDEAVRYSQLPDYMPQRNEDGDYAERWIYWRVMDQAPQIQDGPVGPLSTMFREQFWQGLMIRVKGNGLSKCLLIPRGHLKSTIATQARSLWRIIRDPDSRTLIRSLTQDTAKMFCADVKFAFESNEEFRRYYGNMGEPDKGVAPWNADQLQVRNTKGKFKSRGKEYTLTSKGMESSLTSMHCDYVTLDDVVGEGNTETATLRANARTKIEQMMAIPDPGSPFEDIGTRWEEDDVHSMFTDPNRSDMEQDSSFMIATVLDGDDSKVGEEYIHPAPRHISPMGYGKPIWPEAYTLREVARKRRSIKDDRVWYSQYYNQIIGTGNRTFSRSWVQRYEGIPHTIAENRHLNIFIYFDTASGKKEQSGKLDYTAAFVLGQTPDRRGYFWLDGFKEKLPAKEMLEGMVKIARKWKKICSRYGGTFSCGVEQTAYTNFLSEALDLYQRTNVQGDYVSFEGMSHGNVAKPDRIRTLAQPYRDGLILWPHELVVESNIEGNDPIDLIEMMLEEFTKWPGIPNEDLLDSHAGAFAQTFMPDFEPDPLIKKDAMDPSIWKRGEQDAFKVRDSEFLGEYGNNEKEWRLI